MDLELAKELAASSFATFLIVILIAGKYRWWVFGSYYDEMLKDKEEQIEYERREKEQWRAMAMQTRDLTERSVAVAAKAVVGKHP